MAVLVDQRAAVDAMHGQGDFVEVVRPIEDPRDQELGIVFFGCLALERQRHVSRLVEARLQQVVDERLVVDLVEEIVRQQIEGERLGRHQRHPGIVLAEAGPDVERKNRGPLAELRFRNGALDDLALLVLDGDAGHCRTQVGAAERQRQHQAGDAQVDGNPHFLGPRHAVSPRPAVEPGQHEHRRQEQQDRREHDSGPMRRQEELVHDEVGELHTAPRHADVERDGMGHAALHEVPHQRCHRRSPFRTASPVPHRGGRQPCNLAGSGPTVKTSSTVAADGAETSVICSRCPSAN